MKIPPAERHLHSVALWRDDMIAEQTVWCAVQGYAVPQAVRQGEKVGICVSSRTPRFGMRVVRDSAEEEIVLEREIDGAVEHVVPEDTAARGCAWPITVELETADLRPGFYLVNMVPPGRENDENQWGHAFFVVKPRLADRASILLKLSTNTYNAYNHWGGPSLYDLGTCVAYDRPLIRGMLRRYGEAARLRAGVAPDVGYTGDPNMRDYYRYILAHEYSLRAPLAGWFNWERTFFAWAEKRDYAVDLCLDNDAALPGELEGYDLVLSVGHDEYWTMQARDTLSDWVTAGGNLAVFSGNTAYWHVRIEDEAMVCHKYGAEETDPVVGTDRQHLLTGPFSHRWLGKPENALIGAGSTGGLYARFGGGVPHGSGAFDVCRPDHWAFEGTDLRYGDQFGGTAAIVSFEVNGTRYQFTEGGLPVPTGEFGTPGNFEIIATSPAILWSSDPKYSDYSEILAPPPEAPGDAEAVAQAAYGSRDTELVARLRRGAATMGSMTLGRGEVFSGSTTDWAHGLGVDPMVDRVTRNVLNRFTLE